MDEPSQAYLMLHAFIKGRIVLKRCDECRAMIQPDDEFQHQSWHDKLDETWAAARGMEPGV
jgi:hypothetical protein